MFGFRILCKTKEEKRIRKEKKRRKSTLSYLQWEDRFLCEEYTDYRCGACSLLDCKNNRANSGIIEARIDKQHRKWSGSGLRRYSPIGAQG